MNKNLYAKSIKIILKNQTPIGAYIASPNFESYHYSWIRDGSYIAYAMDLAQEPQSSASFHDWVADIVLSRADVVNLLNPQNALGMIKEGNFLHTRFTMDGKEALEDWPNFQLDGFGTWLWALTKHTELSKRRLSEKCLQAAELIGRYLTTLWQIPCYDLWEEHPDVVHPYTLACIYGGLSSIGKYLENDFGHEADEIKNYILENYIHDGYISKFRNNPMVDASLIGLAVPYGLLPLSDPAMQATITQIERQLIRDGGVHRYSEDSYYGGGEWIILSAWLGWYHAQAGEMEKVIPIMDWIEKQMDSELNLPEQVPHALNYVDKYTYWEQRWGKIANPLLWSHAKYIVLSKKMKEIHQ